MSTWTIKISDGFSAGHKYTITDARGNASIEEVSQIATLFLKGKRRHDGPVDPQSPTLETALQDCVAVMERELKGLAVIQPELRQAKQALGTYKAEVAP